MHQPAVYDALADIYDIWEKTRPVAKRNLPFYVEEYLSTVGPVVELGVGNGRIAIEAARRGKPIIGVDASAEMLKLCQERAQAASVAHLLTLIQADFRDFTLPEPAQLIAIPFNTIGHLVTLDDKRAVLRHIYDQLVPGGRLIFDQFVFDPEEARLHHGVARLRAEYSDAATGQDVLLWFAFHYDLEAQIRRCITWTDELNDDGVVIRRKYRRLNNSWLDPQQTRALLEETGFEVEAIYGDFDRRPFSEDSSEQIWVARRPAED